jgi:hypothetical protein
LVPAEGERSRLRQDARWSFPGARGLRDLWHGWRDYRELWLAVGWYDIRKRYRRSLLGPFWITISLGAFIAALTFLYVPLIGGDVNGFLSFVAFGFIAWQFMSQLVIEGCNVFIANGPIIQQFRAPLSVYIYESVWKNLIILAHNFLIYVFIVVLFGLWPSWATLLVVPGIILICINGVIVGMLLGEQTGRRVAGRRQLRRGEGGRERVLRDHQAEWIANLERFRGNLTMTSALGAAARETAETSFSLRATLPKIAEILQSAATLRRSTRRTPSRTALRSGLPRSAGSSGAAPPQ